MSGLSLPDASTLELVGESKLYQLLAGSSEDDSIDASGICVMNGNFYVTFKDSAHIARVGPTLSQDDPANGLYRFPDDDIGREDITFDPVLGRLLVVTEAVRQADGNFKPKVTVFDSQLRFIEEGPLEFALEGKHKGMEGLSCIHRQGHPFLLGLCEGNFCRGGRRGRQPGGGRIQVFEKGHGSWMPVATIELPQALRFENYSSLSVRGDKIAVVSRDASAVWLGQLSANTWSITGPGAVYRFPLTRKGNIIYCAIDGISWLADDEVVAVSDRCHSAFRFQKRCRNTDQSIHVFRFPGV